MELEKVNEQQYFTFRKVVPDAHSTYSFPSISWPGAAQEPDAANIGCRMRSWTSRACSQSTWL